MKPAKKNRVIASGALLAIIATAAVACSKSSSSSTHPRQYQYRHPSW